MNNYSSYTIIPRKENSSRFNEKLLHLTRQQRIYTKIVRNESIIISLEIIISQCDSHQTYELEHQYLEIGSQIFHLKSFLVKIIVESSLNISIKLFNYLRYNVHIFMDTCSGELYIDTCI